MLIDGRAAALWGAGVGWPAFTALAKSGGRFIAPSAGEVERILARQPALQAVTLPARTYPGQDAALHSVGSWGLLLARPGLPEKNAHLPARAIHPAQAPLAAPPPPPRETTKS